MFPVWYSKVIRNYFKYYCDIFNFYNFSFFSRHLFSTCQLNHVIVVAVKAAVWQANSLNFVQSLLSPWCCWHRVYRRQWKGCAHAGWLSLHLIKQIKVATQDDSVTCTHLFLFIVEIDWQTRDVVDSNTMTNQSSRMVSTEQTLWTSLQWQQAAQQDWYWFPLKPLLYWLHAVFISLQIFPGPTNYFSVVQMNWWGFNKDVVENKKKSLLFFTLQFNFSF